MKIYKIGIIGCGGIAQKMAATLEKMKGVERYAVASRNQEKANKYTFVWKKTVEKNRAKLLEKTSAA